MRPERQDGRRAFDGDLCEGLRRAGGNCLAPRERTLRASAARDLLETVVRRTPAARSAAKPVPHPFFQLLCASVRRNGLALFSLREPCELESRGPVAPPPIPVAPGVAGINSCLQQQSKGPVHVGSARARRRRGRRGARAHQQSVRRCLRIPRTSDRVAIPRRPDGRRSGAHQAHSR
jgi:hypothetical protein